MRRTRSTPETLRTGGTGPTIGERLAQVRDRLFVGRTAEQALFQSALSSEEPLFSVLWLVGPGGVGKTTLLARLARLAGEQGIVPIHVDARQLVGTPGSFLSVLAAALGVGDAEAVLAAMHDGLRRVLFIDTAEELGSVETWLRKEFIPQLPSRTLVVFASRTSPEAGWRGDGGWGELLRVVALRNLSREESRSLLEARGVDVTEHEQLMLSTFGLPLALSLVADVLKQSDQVPPASALQSPDVVAALLERFAHDAPDAEHRLALYAAAHVRVIDEALLRHAVSAERAEALFAWLASLSFVEASSEGLHLHDLAACALDVELRRRDPERYAQMHKRLREPCVRVLAESAGAAQYRAAADLCWMHRFSAVMGAVVDWPGARALYPSALGAADHGEVVEATRRLQGDAAAECIAYWLEAQPEAFTIVRSSPTHAKGYILTLSVESSDHDACARDPRVAQALAYVQHKSALRPGERVCIETWLDYTTYLDPGAMVAQVSIRSIRAWLGQPGHAWSFYAVPARLDVWAPLMAYLEHHPGPRAAVGDIEFLLFAHDWRVMPPKAFLDLMADREIAGERGALPAREQPSPVLVLSRDAFGDAVRSALREYANPEALAQNPLTRCRVVLDAGGGGSTLRRLIDEAAAQLTVSGKDERPFAALKVTYLDAARTQEEAAELLSIPFSSYRRYLRTAVERVIESLWQRELHGSGP